MHRYYMTAETRHALIAESNRLIAARTAADARRRQLTSDSASTLDESARLGLKGDTDASGFDASSTFARLVQDLQETSVCLRS